MKKLSLLLVAILFAVTGILAQTPNQFKYQAVLRDAGGQIMAEEAVTVDISILQGSASGTRVFDEQHSVTTTAQGLINLNIGSVEDLSVVDFSADTYFIEISVNSTIMGTSQLLSVPYALQAKEVENVDYLQITNTPVIPEDVADLTDNSNLLFDGDWTSLTNTPTTIAGYGITDAFSGSYTDLTNKPVNATTTEDGFMSSTDKTKLDGLENANITAGTGISVTGTYPDITVATTSPTYTIGLNIDLGGYVFYVTPDGKHGLVAETQDQSISCTWYNAEDIISTPPNHSPAGEYFTDWRLPTKYELNLMYDQKVNIGGFASADYWSSTENNYTSAWIQNFSDGNQDNIGKANTNYVRAVRAF